jgi:hypothetical protein
VLHNNGLQLTRSARSALRGTDRGQSLRAALAAEAECSTGYSSNLPVAVLAFAVAVLLGPARAEACSCGATMLNEQFAEATLVFRGYLATATPHPSDPTADESLTFFVTEAWKGKMGRTVALRSQGVGRRKDGSLPGEEQMMAHIRCPMYIEQKQEYIVLVGKDMRLGYCSTIIPVPSTLAPEFQRRLRLLAQGRQP